MTNYNFDIDIDFFNRDQLLDVIPHVVASRLDGKKRKKHNTGVYLQAIPNDPLENISTIDYKTAEARGYFKLDFLNVGAYAGVRDEEHLLKLMNTEPIWELLEEKEICERLFHISDHLWLVKQLKPKSVVELATLLALIRPGAKHLIAPCIEHGYDSIQSQVWASNDQNYVFKKSHGISYAYVIIVQLNLICEQALQENNGPGTSV